MTRRDAISFIIGALSALIGDSIGTAMVAHGHELAPTRPPASQEERDLCVRLHEFLIETDQYDDEVVRIRRDDDSPPINCGWTINSIPKIEIRL